MPVETISSAGGNYVSLIYTKVIAASDITYIVQVFGDLQTWNAGSGYTTAPTETNNSDGLTQSVTVQTIPPVNATLAKQFIRLKVRRP